MKDTEIILNNITKKLFGDKYTFSKMSEKEREMVKQEYQDLKKIMNINEEDLKVRPEVDLIDFKSVKNDGNGNPRYVCHFLNFADNYPRALFLANQIGGRKFHNKQYGGGIVFQSYNIKNLESQILKIKENA
tara:strand:- start:2539 stop:2934 length:396 start_codon:yes stop_codon:yes gene_type:complete